MDILRERRIGTDRREYAIYYRYGIEHRANIERRKEEVGEGGMPASNRVISLGDIARLLSSRKR